MNSREENVAGRRRINRNVLIAVGVALAVLLLCAGVGAVFGEDRADDEAPAPTTTAAAPSPAAQPAPVAPAPPSVTSSAEVPTTTAAAPPPATADYSDPRCAPASAELVAQVAAGLTAEGNQLANGTVISEGGITYFGATTVDAAGDMDARSDVWIVRDGAVYSSTGGARGNSNFPRASDALGISPGDPIVTAVDTCVIDLTE